MNARGSEAGAPRRASGSHLAPPCRSACPLDKDVPGFLRAVARGDTGLAWQIVLRDNLFPGVMSHVCPRPCERVCRRGRRDASVPICSLKRWVAAQEGNGKHPVPRFETGGPRIAIYGAGPAGLAAAHDLTVLGARVALFDQRDVVGGLLSDCIPEFRLPSEIVQQDLARILAMDVEFHPNTRLHDVDEAASLRSRGFVAVILALGAGSDRPPEIAGWKEHPATQTAIEFLRRFREGAATLSARRVVVIGGGNAALDVSRAALRLGATEVAVLYRRDWRDMRALAKEVEQAASEGVRFISNTVVDEIVWQGGRLRGVRLSGAGASTTPSPWQPEVAAPPGEGLFWEADAVFSAIGQTSSFRDTMSAQAIEALETGGVFVCGDLASGPSSVAEAIASGRRAASRARAHLARSEGWEITPRAMDRLHSGWLPTPSDGQNGSQPSVSCALSGGADPQTDAGSCLRCDYSLHLHPDRCVLCGECVTRCAEQSLQFNPNRGTGGFVLSVDDATCTRCGDCIRTCPVSALSWTLWTSTNRHLDTIPAPV